MNRLVHVLVVLAIAGGLVGMIVTAIVRSGVRGEILQIVDGIALVQTTQEAQDRGPTFWVELRDPSRYAVGDEIALVEWPGRLIVTKGH